MVCGFSGTDGFIFYRLRGNGEAYAFLAEMAAMGVAYVVCHLDSYRKRRRINNFDR